MCITTQRRNHPVPIAFKQKRSIITQHNYHDHANDTINTATSKYGTPSQQISTLLFPSKLHKVLSQIEEDGFDNIISWQPHGRCFVIHKSDEFKAFILPRYFDTSKMSSFQRQLSLYGFIRFSKGPDRGGYYHELFLRGMPSLACGIVRKKVKGTGVRAKANPDSEPNLWFMSWVGVPSSSSGQNQHENQQDMKSTVLSCSTESTEAQHLMVPNEVLSSPSSSSTTSMIPTSSASNAEVTHHVSCDDVASFAGRNFHCLEASSFLQADGFLSDLQSWEADVESILRDSDNEDDFVNILESILS